MQPGKAHLTAGEPMVTITITRPAAALLGSPQLSALEVPAEGPLEASTTGAQAAAAATATASSEVMVSSTTTVSLAVGSMAGAVVDENTREDLAAMVASIVAAQRGRTQILRAEVVAAAAAASEMDACSEDGSSSSGSSTSTCTRKAAPHPMETDLQSMQIIPEISFKYCKVTPLAATAGLETATAAAGRATAATARLAGAFRPLHADVEVTTRHAHPADESKRWLLSFAPDACTYAILYSMSTLEDDGEALRYDLDAAVAGGQPTKLDLGNALYAPTTFRDPAGRHVLWGWIKVGPHHHHHAWHTCMHACIEMGRNEVPSSCMHACTACP